MASRKSDETSQIMKVMQHIEVVGCGVQIVYGVRRKSKPTQFFNYSDGVASPVKVIKRGYYTGYVRSETDQTIINAVLEAFHG